MRIIALTFGTEGDTRPMVALCRGLHDAGHDVLLLAERNGAAYADALDVPFVPLAGDMAVAMRTAAAGVSRRGADVHYVARTLAAIAAANTGEWLRAALAHAHGRDLVLCAGLAIYVGFSAAEALRIRAIGVGLQPMMPTRAFASPFLPPLPLPRFVNRASHWLVLSLMWRAFRGPINAARRDVAGQALRARAWDDYPVLFGVSPTLVPRPDDWTDRVAMSGYWFGPRDPRFVADRDLVEFIDACEAPVYVGFGSMLGFDHARLLRLARRRARCGHAEPAQPALRLQRRGARDRRKLLGEARRARASRYAIVTPTASRIHASICATPSATPFSAAIFAPTPRARACMAGARAASWRSRRRPALSRRCVSISGATPTLSRRLAQKN